MSNPPENLYESARNSAGILTNTDPGGVCVRRLTLFGYDTARPSSGVAGFVLTINAEASHG